MITTGLTEYQTRARQEVYEICQTGKTIYLKKAATLDEMGSPLTESTLTFKSHPVRFAPFDRKVLQKYSWTDSVNVMCSISYLDMLNQSLRLEDLKTYTELHVEGRKFNLKQVETSGSFGEYWLYVHLGGADES